ncbi:MAG: TolC family protein [Bacteroidales bacterium]
MVEKSEQDIRESVVTTYYLILISEESLSTIEGNIENLKEVLKSTEAMYSVGMAGGDRCRPDEIDTDDG